MTVFRWRCWLRALWYLFRYPPRISGPFAGAFTSGHEYHNEIPEGAKPVNDYDEFPALVTVSKCVDCGEYDVMWRLT